MLMDFLGQRRFVDRAMEDFFFFDWKPYEEELLEVLSEKKDQYIEDRLRDVKIVEVDHTNVACVFLSNHESDVLNRILETQPDVKCAIGIKMDGSGKVSVRSRSEDEFDAAEFCQKHGGGGHAKAAGHSIDNDTLLDIISTVYP
jgi:nanoRNase/pAp phosphatase (c-di-AMP/oligoRNAs hydrolase)